jgi:signal transduction histidine kinase
VLLVVVLATVTWLAIGRSLAPVEGIRARAEAITGQNLDRRVPVPDQLDEIGRLARTVNQMLGRLERSAARQRRFVADAAHELRSPIASLRVQLETARDTEETAGREGDMLYETTRMEGLVDQLVVLARADADTSWLRLETVDLDDLIDSAVTSLAPRDGLVIDTNAVEPVQLCGDARMLEQVVRNLVHNALGHARGTVRVSTSAAGDDLAVLIVDDDGPGVPEDRRDDIFERFVRLDASRDRDHGGVGLGLAIVAEIVRAHGGRVHVGDSPSGGARFVVELPITAVDTHTSQSTPGIR